MFSVKVRFFTQLDYGSNTTKYTLIKSSTTLQSYIIDSFENIEGTNQKNVHIFSLILRVQYVQEYSEFSSTQ